MNISLGMLVCLRVLCGCRIVMVHQSTRPLLAVASLVSEERSSNANALRPYPSIFGLTPTLRRMGYTQGTNELILLSLSLSLSLRL